MARFLNTSGTNDQLEELIKAARDRKSELAPAEFEWLKALTYERTSFCKNLHAKCYLSESACIVTSLNPSGPSDHAARTRVQPQALSTRTFPLTT